MDLEAAGGAAAAAHGKVSRPARGLGSLDSLCSSVLGGLCCSISWLNPD
jgi:hypothetical protein